MPSSQRYYLTANGIRQAAELLGFATPADFVRAYPVSREWLPSPSVDAVAHVSSPALTVCREGRAPDALRGRELGAIPVSDVANALGRQRVASVSTSSSTLDKAPGIDEAVHHLADAPLRDAEPHG